MGFPKPSGFCGFCELSSFQGDFQTGAVTRWTNTKLLELLYPQQIRSLYSRVHRRNLIVPFGPDHLWWHSWAAFPKLLFPGARSCTEGLPLELPVLWPRGSVLIRTRFSFIPCLSSSLLTFGRWAIFFVIHSCSDLGFVSSPGSMYIDFVLSPRSL